MNGYTQTIDPETKRHNELHAVTEIVIANPTNEYWQSRLADVRDRIDTDKLADLINLCNTDPAHILNTETEADWLQSENAAALYMEGTEPSPFISGGEVCYPSDMTYKPATEPDDDMPF